MQKDRVVLTALIFSTSLAVGCTTPTSSSSKSATNNPPSAATASLKVMIWPEWPEATASWNLNEIKATVSGVAMTRGGTTVGEGKLNSPEIDIAYPKSFRSVDVPSGTFDGLNLSMSVNRTLLWDLDNQGMTLASRSVPINFNNPLSFAKALEIPANKRTLIVFKPSFRAMGEPGAFNLTPACFTIESHLQELVSPNGYPMAYLNHFFPFSFTDPDGVAEYEETDLQPGPFGPNGEAAFNSNYSNGEQLKQFADLGEKELKSITTVPPSEQFVYQVGIIQGHCYVVKSKGNYAKFRAISVGNNMREDVSPVVIEYHYQSDGATTFSK